MRLPTVLFFVAMTFLCWGSYGPTLHEGQIAMGHSRWRPFICVGMAYFLIAVVVPWILLSIQSEKGRWTVSGTIWSVFAGAVGAIGALGIILAFQFGGTPVFIMPLIFGLAPVVNTFVTMAMNRTHREASVPFYIALAVVALGAAGVLVFKPSVSRTAAAETQSESADDVAPGNSGSKTVDYKSNAESNAESTDMARWQQEVQQLKQKQVELTQEIDRLRKLHEESSDSESKEPKPDAASGAATDGSAAPRAEVDQPAGVSGDLSYRADISADVTQGNEGSGDSESEDEAGESDQGYFRTLQCVLAVIMTAICWGAYGPMLHKGQSRMEGSRFRPFICVGMAYFLIAVIVPTLVLMGADDGAHFTMRGTFWSLFAGAVGAIGAMGIIMAFNFGGRPVFVMPLVFGGAPVVNTIISMTQSYFHTGKFGEISSQFLGALLMVMVGAICVLIFAPRPGGKPPGDDNDESM